MKMAEGDRNVTIGSGLPTSVLEALTRRLGPEAVDASWPARALAGQDVFTDDESRYPLAVVAPSSAETVAQTLTILSAHGIAVAPHGGGMSYTEGFLPTRAYVSIDTRRLNRIRLLAPADRLLIAEAGCSWAAIAETLAAENLLPAVKPPISGSISTVGGAASQNLPSGMENFLGLEVALADGTMIRTGVLSTGETPLPLRNFGPDLTGLFLGDCGAFGVKTAAALRLRPKPEKQGFASFAFPSMAAVTRAMLAMQERGPPLALMALDSLDRQGGAALSWREKLETARAMLAARRYAPSAFVDLAGGLTAPDQLARASFSLHVTIEGIDSAHVAALQNRVFTIARREGGAPIPPTLPQALAAKPFSVRGILGRDGERWAPVHGIFAPSRALAATEAVEAFFAEHDEAMRRHGVTRSFLFSAASDSFLIEPMFYWRDKIPALHRSVLPARTLAKIPASTASLETRRVVRTLRLALAHRFDSLGAAKCQLGRLYSYGPRLVPETMALAQTVKQALDPSGVMNPGVLGLGA
jgi:D-lactate dehydrogenase (cytochrome)